MSQQVRLKSAARHIYAGRLIHTGDEFLADVNDARDLIALNFAREVLPPMSAENSAPLVVATRPRRAYRRRDMKAEGTSG